VQQHEPEHEHEQEWDITMTCFFTAGS
jgi:hypothetical protein